MTDTYAPVTVQLSHAELAAIDELTDGLPYAQVLRFWLEDELAWAQRFAAMRRETRAAGKKRTGRVGSAAVPAGEPADAAQPKPTWLPACPFCGKAVTGDDMRASGVPLRHADCAGEAS